MLQFILRRLGLVIPTFIGITLLTFAFVHMIPGDPVMIMAGERGISPERHAQLLAELGLDKPMWQQYLHYIWGVMHGDLGISLKSRLPVWDEFVPRFKATLELGVCAMIFAVSVGIPVGVLAAVKRGSIFDHTAVGLALSAAAENPLEQVGQVDIVGAGTAHSTAERIAAGQDVDIAAD